MADKTLALAAEDGDAQSIRLLADSYIKLQEPESRGFLSICEQTESRLAHKFGADALIAEGETGHAERLLVQWAEQHQDSAAAARMLIDGLFKIGHSARARQLLDESLLKHPDDGSLGWLQAQYLLSTGEKRSALALLERHAKESPANEDISTLLVRTLFSTGRIASMPGVFSGFFGPAWGGEPWRSATSRLKTRTRIEKKGAFEEAIAQYRKALELDPGSVGALYLLSELLQRLGRTGGDGDDDADRP